MTRSDSGNDNDPDRTGAPTIGCGAEQGLKARIIGGCCGTTPEHIAAVVAALA